MLKWVNYKASEKANASVITQVTENRKYLSVIIQCLIFVVQQNLALRGHKE